MPELTGLPSIPGMSPLKALVLFAFLLGGGGGGGCGSGQVSARIVLNAGNPDAKRLYDDLLSNYNKLVRPVVNTTDPLTVRIKLKLSQLIDVVSHAYQNPQGNFQMASSKKSLKNSILILSQRRLYYQAKKTRLLSTEMHLALLC